MEYAYYILSKKKQKKEYYKLEKKNTSDLFSNKLKFILFIVLFFII